MSSTIDGTIRNSKSSVKTEQESSSEVTDSSEDTEKTVRCKLLNDVTDRKEMTLRCQNNCPDSTEAIFMDAVEIYKGLRTTYLRVRQPKP